MLLILCLVINSYFKEITNINFYFTLNCFAVLCKKFRLLNELLKSAYFIIYLDSKYLVQFNKKNFILSSSIINSNYGENAGTLTKI